MCMGFQTEGYTWEPQVEFLNRLGFLCLTFDNRGCGRSERPLYRYTTSMFARDAMELMCVELGWRPEEVHLLGISMGGMYSLEMLAGLAEGTFADVAPGSQTFLSASLMVTQTAGLRQGAKGLVPLGFFQSVASASQPGISPRAKIYRGMEQAFSRHWLRAESGMRHPKTGAALTNGQLMARRGAKQYHAKRNDGVDPENGGASWLAQVLAIATHRVSPARLQHLARTMQGRCPLLVVCAGRDKLVNPEAQVGVAAALKPAVTELLMLPESSHGVTDECRDEVNAAIVRLVQCAEQPRPGPAPAAAPLSRL